MSRVRMRRKAGGQWGRIHCDQLRDLGVDRAKISRWVAEGYLSPVHPRVYAVGHSAPSVEADLTAAILFAGPEAMLSHATAAWWWGLTDRKPRLIDVTTPRRCRSRPTVSVHDRRTLERVWHNRLPVTTVAQTLLDVAATQPLDDVRYMVAEADYHRLLSFDVLERVMGRGKPGSGTLRRAIAIHNPDLARTRSRLERAFVALCERGGVPRPLVNVRVCGFTVDFYWPEHGVVVELDGGRGHSTERQVARDHGRDLKLRAKGIVVRRYAEVQVDQQGELVLVDLLAALGLGAKAA